MSWFLLLGRIPEDIWKDKYFEETPSRFVGLFLEEVTRARVKSHFRRFGRWEDYTEEEDLMEKWAQAQQDTFHIV
jgi:hypothetical protein